MPNVYKKLLLTIIFKKSTEVENNVIVATDCFVKCERKNGRVINDTDLPMMLDNVYNNICFLEEIFLSIKFKTDFNKNN